MKFKGLGLCQLAFQLIVSHASVARMASISSSMRRRSKLSWLSQKSSVVPVGSQRSFRSNIRNASFCPCSRLPKSDSDSSEIESETDPFTRPLGELSLAETAIMEGQLSKLQKYIGLFKPKRIPISADVIVRCAERQQWKILEFLKLSRLLTIDGSIMERTDSVDKVAADLIDTIMSLRGEYFHDKSYVLNACCTGNLLVIQYWTQASIYGRQYLKVMIGEGLKEASFHGCVQVIEFLVIAARSMNPALHLEPLINDALPLAAARNESSAMATLLDFGSQTECNTKMQPDLRKGMKGAFRRAASNGNFQCFEIVLQFASEAFSRYEFRTMIEIALHAAASENQPSIINYLLKTAVPNNFPPRVLEDFIEIVIIQAAIKSCMDVISEVIDFLSTNKDLSVERAIREGILEASMAGHPAPIEALIELAKNSKPEIGIVEEIRKSILRACRRNNFSILSILVSKGGLDDRTLLSTFLEVAQDSIEDWNSYFLIDLMNKIHLSWVVYRKIAIEVVGRFAMNGDVSMVADLLMKMKEFRMTRATTDLSSKSEKKIERPNTASGRIETVVSQALENSSHSMIKDVGHKCSTVSKSKSFDSTKFSGKNLQNLEPLIPLNILMTWIINPKCIPILFENIPLSQIVEAHCLAATGDPEVEWTTIDAVVTLKYSSLSIEVQILIDSNREKRVQINQMILRARNSLGNDWSYSRILDTIKIVNQEMIQSHNEAGIVAEGSANSNENTTSKHAKKNTLKKTIDTGYGNEDVDELLLNVPMDKTRKIEDLSCKSNSPIECPICMCTIDLRTEQAIQLKCHRKHVFHEACIFESLSVRPSCPVCRRQF